MTRQQQATFVILNWLKSVKRLMLIAPSSFLLKTFRATLFRRKFEVFRTFKQGRFDGLCDSFGSTPLQRHCQQHT